MVEPLIFEVAEGVDGTHPYLSDIAMFHAISWRASASIMDLPSNPRTITFACYTMNAQVTLPLEGYLEAIPTGKPPATVHLIVQTLNRPTAKAKMVGLEALQSRLICASFSLFSERAGDWVRTNHQTDCHNWPPITNFCRVVRNAIAHGGSINISSPKAPTVGWKKLEYSHLSNGRRIIGTDLEMGDLLILMVMADYELIALGANSHLWNT